MADREPSRHVVRGLLGGLILGLGLALLLTLFRVTAVGSDVVVGACLVLGLLVGAVRLPRGTSRS